MSITRSNFSRYPTSLSQNNFSKAFLTHNKKGSHYSMFLPPVSLVPHQKQSRNILIDHHRINLKKKVGKILKGVGVLLRMGVGAVIAPCHVKQGINIKNRGVAVPLTLNPKYFLRRKGLSPHHLIDDKHFIWQLVLRWSGVLQIKLLNQIDTA